MPNKPQQGPRSLSSMIGKAISGMTSKVKQAASSIKPGQTPQQQQKPVAPKKTLGQQNIDAANAAQAAVDAENKPGWKQDQKGNKKTRIVRK